MGLFNIEDVALDLGTANVRIYLKEKGIVINEPSIIAVNKDSGEMLAIGEEARIMFGRAPGNIVVVRPLKDGVISSYYDTERMLRFFLRKVIGRRLVLKPRVLVCVPSGVTEVEQRSLIEATEEAGARQANLIEEPVAAAIGAGIDIGAPYGSMVIDIGGGTTDIAIFSLGGIVINESVKVAGDKFDEAIIRYMRKKHNMLIGEMTAQNIKINVGSAYPRKEQIYMEVAGRSMGTGLPKTVILNSNETVEAFTAPLDIILESIRRVLERTPPELTADIAESGVCMTGGGSLLYGLDKLISEKTGLSCYVAEDAISCVVLGTGQALDNVGLYDSLSDYNRYESE